MSVDESYGQKDAEESLANRVTGPHWASEEHGAAFYSFFECRECGAQSVNRRDLLGCCDA